jgi:hypothetical protein
VVRRVDRREQPHAAQVGVHREQALAQVLRALEVREEPRHENTAVRLLLALLREDALASAATLRRTRRLLATAEDDDLVDIEDRRRARDLPDQERAELVRLRVVDDRAGQRDRHRPGPTAGGGVAVGERTGGARFAGAMLVLQGARRRGTTRSCSAGRRCGTRATSVCVLLGRACFDAPRLLDAADRLRRPLGLSGEALSERTGDHCARGLLYPGYVLPLLAWLIKEASSGIALLLSTKAARDARRRLNSHQRVRAHDK